MNKQLINLGHLSPEQKEETWAKSISGSQAWMLIYEPYNLIRDKLGVPRIHKSKYDIFGKPHLKAASESAMANGRYYEQYVFGELKSNSGYENIISKDETYQLKIDTFPNAIITCTPDWIKLDENGNIIKFGDIKCSSAADDGAAMSERYYPQLLHNAYVLGCNVAELNTKGIISKSLYTYDFSSALTPTELADYEQRLLSFFYYLENGMADAYDSMVNEGTTKPENKEVVSETIENQERISDLERLMQLKDAESITKKEIENLESKLGLKANYTNAELTFGNHVLTISTSITKPSLDWKAACTYLMDKLGYNENMLGFFMKEGTARKTMKFKKVGE